MTHQFTWLTKLFLMIFLIFAISTNVFSQNPIIVKQKVLNKKWNKGKSSATIKYPVLQGLKSKSFEKQINNEIYNDNVGNIDPNYASYDRGYEVEYNGNGLLSISLVFHLYYEGTNHGINGATILNIDIDGNKKLSLGDIICDFEYFSKIANEMLLIHLNKTWEDLNYSLKNADYFIDKLEVEKDDAFYLTEKSIVLYYPQYEIAPYSEGEQFISIPYSFCGSLFIPTCPLIKKEIDESLFSISNIFKPIYDKYIFNKVAFAAKDEFESTLAYNERINTAKENEKYLIQKWDSLTVSSFKKAKEIIIADIDRNKISVKTKTDFISEYDADNEIFSISTPEVSYEESINVKVPLSDAKIFKSNEKKLIVYLIKKKKIDLLEYDYTLEYVENPQNGKRYFIAD